MQFFNAYARAAIEWSQVRIEESHKQWLSELPLTHSLEDVLFVHATPKDPGAWNYIHNPEEAAVHFGVMSQEKPHSSDTRIFPRILRVLKTAGS